MHPSITVLKIIPFMTLDKNYSWRSL